MKQPRSLLRWIAVCTLASALPLVAQWQSIGPMTSSKWTDREVTLHAGAAILRITVLADDVVRVRLNPTGAFEEDRSWAVLGTLSGARRCDVTDSADRLQLSTGVLRISITKNPVRITFSDTAGALLNADDAQRGMAWAGREVRVWKTMPEDEEYFGFGEKAGVLDRKGTHMTMWNSDIPGYAADFDPLYQTIPFFFALHSGRATGIFFDNTFRSSFDMGKQLRDAYSFGAEGGELNYYFFAGPTPRDVVRRFTDLVGRMSMPPRWALGYQQCRWSYPTEQRVREIARGFRDRAIPCDVIYLDIDYMDGYRIFTWNRTTFPDPAVMVRDLASDGFTVAVIVDPGIKVDSAYAAYRSGLAGNHFLRYPDGRLYTGKVWPGVCAFPDFTSDAARTWWGDSFRDLVRVGVRGWWNDMNEPSVFDVPTKTIDLDVVHDDGGRKTPHARNHNVYGMQMTRATREGVQRLTPDERVFVLTRASYAGGHRYSAAWTGDNVATWEHLGMALRMCLNLSVSGQPFVGSDIGGFMGYPSGELFARWLQLGVFTPLMRAHSVINEKNKEPWEYGDEFTAINRSTINLRYRFMPLIYSVMQQASATGIPAMRPLAFEFPKDANVLFVDDAFMFGDNLLVAPVLAEGQRSREIDLPAGRWYNFWTDQEYEGGKRVRLEAPLDQLPILVRAGTILPTQQVVQYTSQAPIDPLTLILFPPSADGVSTASVYEDDGKTLRYQKGDYFERAISQKRSGGAITLTVSAPTGTYRPPKRTLAFEIHGVAAEPVSVSVDGKPVSPLREGRSSGWTYENTRKIVTVATGDPFNACTVAIRLTGVKK